MLFNNTCPICAREVEAYRTYSEGHALPLRFEGIDGVDLSEWGLTPEAAARRLHVVRDGELLAGVPAFLMLWSEMPRFRPLARLVGLPGIRHIAHIVYEGVLAPALFAMHLRRQRRAGAD
ncbi:MAG: DUF393 domain-containing protein [Pseudomonadota bacterium]